MALLQPSGVSLDTKKEKEAVPLQPTEKQSKVRLRARLKYEK
jgi:hypothetical protein